MEALVKEVEVDQSTPTGSKHHNIIFGSDLIHIDYSRNLRREMRKELLVAFIAKCCKMTCSGDSCELLLPHT